MISPTYTSDIPVEVIGQLGSDRHIVAAAHVSIYGGGDEPFGPLEPGKQAGTINYLMQHRHGTPFEHGTLILRVHAPIFLWREWHRHRIGFSYNEQSGRYSKLDPVFHIPHRDRNLIPVEGYKSARPVFGPASDEQYEAIVASLKRGYSASYAEYEFMLEMGCAKEVARECLAVGTYSACWVTANPRSIMAFLSLRTHDKDAKFVSFPQAEIEEAARKVEAIFAEYWPDTYKAYCDNGRVGP